MKYHAMIGGQSYLDVDADNDDQARARFAVMLHHRGEGVYKRWRDAGMRVAVMRPFYPSHKHQMPRAKETASCS